MLVGITAAACVRARVRWQRDVADERERSNDARNTARLLQGQLSGLQVRHTPLCGGSGCSCAQGACVRGSGLCAS